MFIGFVSTFLAARWTAAKAAAPHKGLCSHAAHRPFFFLLARFKAVQQSLIIRCSTLLFPFGSVIYVECWTDFAMASNDQVPA